MSWQRRLCAVVLVTCVFPHCSNQAGGDLPEAELISAFDNAVASLSDETGQQIDASLWEDQALFEALVSRVAAELEADGEFQQTHAALTSETYEPATAYCGPGSGDWNHAWYPGECLNEVCWEHDGCYDGVSGLSTGCYWSALTAPCDQGFFEGAAACADSETNTDRFWPIVAVALGTTELQAALDAAACAPAIDSGAAGSSATGQAICDHYASCGLEIDADCAPGQQALLDGFGSQYPVYEANKGDCVRACMTSFSCTEYEAYPGKTWGFCFFCKCNACNPDWDMGAAAVGDECNADGTHDRVCP